MKNPFLSRRLAKLGAALVLALPSSLSAQATYYNMASGDYTENFSGITNTNVWITPTTGSWQGLATNATGTIPSATRITAASTNFSTTSSSGVQRGPENLQLLSTGSTDNTSSTAIDLLLDFAGRNAGNLSFDAAQVANSTGNRVGTLRAYYTTNGTTWAEITGGGLPFAATNNVASSASVSVLLPAAVNNAPTVQMRFYYNNGTGGTTGSRPKISIDNVLVTSTPAGTAPIITGFAPSSGLVGATVTISGFNFGAVPAVKFNGIAAASSVNPEGTQISATVPSGATTGPITVEVAGEPTATSATDFTVIAPGTPVLSLSTNAMAGLNATTGSPSSATNYTVTGTNLGTTPVTVTPDSPLLEVGTNGTTFANSLSLAPSGGTVSNTIYLRVVSTNAVTNYSTLVGHVSGSASNSLAVSGAITNAAPGLAVSTNSLPPFSSTVGNPSTAQSLTVTGSNLTTNVTVGAPAGFEVANDGATWGTNTALAPVSGSVNSLVFVRMGATDVSGARSGNVTVASIGAATQNVAVTGTVALPDTPGVVYWDFNSATPTTGTGGAYASWTFGPLTQGNNNGTTTLFTSTSPSSGYTNPFNVAASGSTNAGAAARVGAFNAASNAFFEVQIIVPGATTASITNVSFGSRSTGTGPAAYSIRSGADDFGSDVFTNSLATNSTWAMYVAPVAITLSNGTNTIRIYGFNGAGTPGANTANWRIDDLTLALGSSGSPYVGWAEGFGLDPSVTTGPTAGAPTADPDSDGFSNTQEYAFGTNPTLGNDALIGAATDLAGGMVVTYIERDTGVTYEVQSTTNLATTPFGPAGITPTVSADQTGVLSGYTRKQFTIAAPAGKGFYRVFATEAP